MSYQPLARKYRPNRFSDLVGQDQVAKALAKAIELNRQPPVALFTGVRGVGKTTIARLYAKALNCEKGPTADPCNECLSCKAITSGNHEDVLEIDGASHTGVDDIRLLRDTLGYVPQRSRFKVIIIDEVHMLSQSAFNALLKTTEEPPAHVIFVFATTELDKVPETIQSRCQIFFLRKISAAAIATRIQDILKSEQVPFEERAVKIVAREGHGSMRDALTFLDRAIAQGAGKVNFDSISKLSSSVSSTIFIEAIDSLVQRNASALQIQIQKMYELGIEFIDATESLATFCRHAFILRDLGDNSTDIEILALDDEEVSSLRAISKRSSPFDLNRIFRTLIKCRSDLTGAAVDRFILENYCLEWCLDPGLPTSNEIKSIQSKPTHERTSPTSIPTRGVGVSAVSPAAAETALPLHQVKPELGFPSSWGELIKLWKQAKPLQGRQFEDSVCLSYSSQLIAIAVNPKSLSGKTLLQKDQHQGFLAQLREIFGFNGVLKIDARDADSDGIESPLETRQKAERDRKDLILNQAKSSPLVRDVLSVFNGKIDKIELTDNAT